MPRFNQSSALLFTRFVEAGVTSPQELANVINVEGPPDLAAIGSIMTRYGVVPVTT